MGSWTCVPTPGTGVWRWLVRGSTALLAAFAHHLFDGPLPWSRLRQGYKLLRLGERYTPARLDAACKKALEVDLIDVRRVERIPWYRPWRRKALPVDNGMAPPPPGRFARPGSTFVHLHAPLQANNNHEGESYDCNR